MYSRDRKFDYVGRARHELLGKCSRIGKGGGPCAQVEKLALNRSGEVYNKRSEARLMCTWARVAEEMWQ